MIDWVPFMRRTDDPKLAYFEGMLTGRGIPHRRSGWSFHAPILDVPRDRLDEVHALLVADFDGEGDSFDDIPDDDPVFEDSEPHDFDGVNCTSPQVGN